MCLHHNSGTILPSSSLDTVSLSCSLLGLSELLKYKKIFKFFFLLSKFYYGLCVLQVHFMGSFILLCEIF